MWTVYVLDEDQNKFVRAKVDGKVLKFKDQTDASIASGILKSEGKRTLVQYETSRRTSTKG